MNGITVKSLNGQVNEFQQVNSILSTVRLQRSHFDTLNFEKHLIMPQFGQINSRFIKVRWQLTKSVGRVVW